MKTEAEKVKKEKEEGQERPSSYHMRKCDGCKTVFPVMNGQTHKCPWCGGDSCEYKNK